MDDRKRKRKRLACLRARKFRQSQPVHAVRKIDTSSSEELDVLDVTTEKRKDQLPERIAHREVDIAESENPHDGNARDDITLNVTDPATSHSDDEYESAGISNASDEIDLAEASVDEDEFDESYYDNDEQSEINKLRAWALSGNPTIPQTKIEGLLDILRPRLIPSLPKSAKSFMKTTSAKYNIKINEDSSEYLYFGMKEYLRATVNREFHADDVIELIINVDGLQLFKSSSKQFWPILCKVYSQQDVYKVFPVAIYAGNHKPASIEEYLLPFINEMDQLSESGLEVDGQKFHMCIKAFVCDRPARAFLKNIKGHGAYWACERCTVRGERVENRTIYPFSGENIEARTDESFRNKSNPEHHIGTSPLLRMRLRVDMVFAFVLDFMHLVYLGVMKKLLNYWIRGNSVTQLRNPVKMQLSSFLVKLQSQIPIEFQRTTRSLTDIDKFKATEFKFLLLYADPVILKRTLSKILYDNFLLLSTACRILWSNKLAVQNCDQAELLLKKFVESASQIYGRKSLISNMHNLIHLAEDVRFMQCPLSLLTAFPFESALGSIKKCLRSGNRPLAQVARRLHESFFTNTETATLQPQITILRKLLPDNRGQVTVKNVKYKEFTIMTKPPNNTVLLEDGRVFKINRMYVPRNGRETDVKVSGWVLDKEKSLFTYPCDSAPMKMWVVRKHSRRNYTYPLNDVSQKMVLFEFSAGREGKMYTMPLLHT